MLIWDMQNILFVIFDDIHCPDVLTVNYHFIAWLFFLLGHVNLIKKKHLIWNISCYSLLISNWVSSFKWEHPCRCMFLFTILIVVSGSWLCANLKIGYTITKCEGHKVRFLRLHSCWGHLPAQNETFINQKKKKKKTILIVCYSFQIAHWYFCILLLWFILGCSHFLVVTMSDSWLILL